MLEVLSDGDCASRGFEGVSVAFPSESASEVSNATVVTACAHVLVYVSQLITSLYHTSRFRIHPKLPVPWFSARAASLARVIRETTLDRYCLP
jgi:hypothetical protein